MTATAAWPQPREGDERALIGRVLGGDRVAARELYERHAPRVYRVVYRMVGDEELAREYTQDTFVKAFQKLDSFRQESALSTWLHAIALSMVRSGLRRVTRLRTREVALEHAVEMAGPGSRNGDPDLRDRLASELEALPEKFRTVVVLHDIEGYTHQEIAGMTGVPEGTCKTRLMYARARLREALAVFRKE